MNEIDILQPLRRLQEPYNRVHEFERPLETESFAWSGSDADSDVAESHLERRDSFDDQRCESCPRHAPDRILVRRFFSKPPPIPSPM